jgi:hypothetical protein
MMKPNALRKFLVLGFMAATLSVNLSLAQTPTIPSMPTSQPSPDGSGNPGGGGTMDPCGTVPCMVAVH